VRLTCWAAALALTGCSAAAPGAGSGASDGGLDSGVTPYSQQLVWSGRVDTNDAKGPRWAWSGTRLKLGFSGSTVKLVVKTVAADDAKDVFPARFRTELDGVVKDTRAGAGGEWVFSEAGMSAGNHQLVVWQQSEANNGVSQLVTLELSDGGRLLPAPSVEPRRIEIIGDSISTAYGNEGKNETCPYDTATQSHWDSYGAIVARALDAELHTVAWSGRGMVRNYEADPTRKTMPVLWQRSLPQDETSTWNAPFAPDAVLIMLGGNDFAAGDPGQPFVDATVALMFQVRQRYPNARIFLVIHANTDDDYPQGAQQRTRTRQYFETAVSRRRAAGDASVAMIELAQRDKADGLGCQFHPNTLTHQKMATELTAKLRAAMGW
jgi:lysophospholipase L1-like esterase